MIKLSLRTQSNKSTYILREKIEKLNYQNYVIPKKRVSLHQAYITILSGTLTHCAAHIQDKETKHTTDRDSDREI